jgi:uncharacterized Zn finger protein
MGLLDIASGNSLWQGMDYYKGNRVSSVKQIANNIFDSEVLGSNSKSYHISIDIEHPRRSKCTCPFAEGRRVICKHMVATYFSIYPEEAKRIIKEAEEYEKEEEQRQQEEYDEIEKYVYSLTEQEARNLLISYIIEERERRSW